jgi:hypothetical protein
VLEPLVRAAEDTAGPAQRRFAIDRLERALACADPGTAADVIDRARALGVSRGAIEASELVMPPHAVLVPFVAADASGRRRALVRAMIVSFDPGEASRDTFGRVAARAVRAAIALAAKDAHTKVDRLHLVPVQPNALAGVEIEGPSLAAAAYLSARALLSGRRVKSGLAVTGAIEGRALVHVESLEDKRAASIARGLSLLAPLVDARRGDAHVRGLADLDALIDHALEAGAADADIEAEVREARDRSGAAWQGYRWRAVRESIARTLVRVPERRPDLRVELLARLAAAERHLGRTAQSLACISVAEEIVATPIAAIAVPDEARTRLTRQKAMTLLTALRLREARAAAKKSVKLAERGHLRGELIASLGAEGLVALAAKNPIDACTRFSVALGHTLEHRPSDAARSRAYYVEALGQARDGKRAKHHYELALREAEDDARRGRPGKIEWVRTSYADALIALDQHASALEVLDHESVTLAIAETPLPGLRARRYLALATIACAESERAVDRGLAMLESSPDAYDGLEPALRATAHVNVLFALRHRLGRGESIDARRLEESLAALPTSVSRVTDRVRRSRGAARLVALDSLLALVERA